MPFSQRSGVLEWCSGTVPIGEFLVEPNKGAHKRFRPQDWANLACRRKMMVWRCWQEKTLATWQHMLAMGSELTAVVFVGLSLQDAQRLAFDEKLQAYNEVCTKFRPVFRYFCMERFLDPAVWMEKRLAYTRSVATSSIGTPSHRVKLIMYCKYKMPQTEGRHIIDVTWN